MILFLEEFKNKTHYKSFKKALYIQTSCIEIKESFLDIPK